MKKKLILFIFAFIITTTLILSSCSRYADPLVPEIPDFEIEVPILEDQSVQSDAEEFYNNYSLSELNLFIGPTDSFRFLSSESQAKIELNFLINNSKSFLISKGFTEAELVEEYGSSTAPQVALLGVILKAIENDGGIPMNGIKNCAFQALGIDRLVDWAKGKYVSSIAARKALIKAVGKAAARMGLGYVGTAIAIAEFSACVYQVIVEDDHHSFYQPGYLPPNIWNTLSEMQKQNFYYFGVAKETRLDSNGLTYFLDSGDVFLPQYFNGLDKAMGEIPVKRFPSDFQGMGSVSYGNGFPAATLALGENMTLYYPISIDTITDLVGNTNVYVFILWNETNFYTDKELTIRAPNGFYYSPYNAIFKNGYYNLVKIENTTNGPLLGNYPFSFPYNYNFQLE